MDSTAPKQPTGRLAAPGNEPRPDGPETLGQLIQELMDQRGYKYLTQLASESETISYQTLWAWKKESRGLVRPPTPSMLDTFARDFRLPRGVVYRAAGRAFPAPDELSEGEQIVLHLYQDMEDEDRRLAETLLRDLAERTRNRKDKPDRKKDTSGSK